MSNEQILLERIKRLEEDIALLKDAISKFEISQISGNINITIADPEQHLQLFVSEVGCDLKVNTQNGDIYLDTGDVGNNVSVTAEDGDVFLDLEEIYGVLDKE
ncbi:MAG TPA: hypothetical protein GX522_07970 [Firmicutes bacterium]|nr:hypothetical protein [Bacillota bacterium]